jgi:hypothetical protein
MNERTRRIVIGLISALVVLMFAGEVTVLVYWAGGTWDERLSAALALVGYYGIGLGLISKSAVLRDHAKVVEEMTSPNPVMFLAGNFTLLFFPFGIASLGLNPRRSGDASPALGCLGQLIIGLMVIPLLFYALFHIFVIVPLAYMAYLLASALISAISDASGDTVLTISSTRETEVEPKSISLKELVTADPPSAKNFLVGVPAAALSLATTMLGVFTS